MKRFTLLPGYLLCLISFVKATSVLGKGLDSLQAETPATMPTPSPATPNGETPANPAPPTVQPEVAPAATQPKAPDPSASAPLPPSSAGGASSEVQAGLQKFYIGSGFSWINLSGSKGGWHSSTMGDVEAGYKVRSLISNKLDLFGTLRYRPVSVDIVADQRAYRAVVESYLFGAKSIMTLNQKTSVDFSAELGMTDTHVNSIDSLVDIDQDLEKSGVDLNLGAGVSYIVLEKIGIGSRIAAGAGAYKTLQIGLDIRFLL